MKILGRRELGSSGDDGGKRFAYQRHVVCRTTRLPKTGPMFRPARRVKMYIDVPKLFERPDFHVSLLSC
jgi:hypothetical protein